MNKRFHWISRNFNKTSRKFKRFHWISLKELLNDAAKSWRSAKRLDLEKFFKEIVIEQIATEFHWWEAHKLSWHN
jgi:hypothetical protein